MGRKHSGPDFHSNINIMKLRKVDNVGRKCMYTRTNQSESGVSAIQVSATVLPPVDFKSSDVCESFTTKNGLSHMHG